MGKKPQPCMKRRTKTSDVCCNGVRILEGCPNLVDEPLQKDRENRFDSVGLSHRICEIENRATRGADRGEELNMIKIDKKFAKIQ